MTFKIVWESVLSLEERKWNLDVEMCGFIRIVSDLQYPTDGLYSHLFWLTNQKGFHLSASELCELCLYRFMFSSCNIFIKAGMKLLKWQIFAREVCCFRLSLKVQGQKNNKTKTCIDEINNMHFKIDRVNFHFKLKYIG